MTKQIADVGRRLKPGRLIALGLGLVVVLLLGASLAQPLPPATSSVLGLSAIGQQTVPPERVVGRDTCKKCHTTEYEAWGKSKHAGSFALLAKPEAAEIAKGAGIDPATVKTNTTCTACHGTQQMQGGALVIAEGNSCESCHGGAGGDPGWLAKHAEVVDGAAGMTMEQLMAARAKEPAAHRAARVAACEQAGMNRAADVLEIADNCMSCHLVPNEKLVNAKHPVSAKFEFVAWANGEVRHNFLLNRDQNAEAPTGWMSEGASRKVEGRTRLMFVVGMLAKLEIALRARSTATVAGGKYVKEQAGIIEDTADEIGDLVKDGVSLPTVAALIKQESLDDNKAIEEISPGDEKKYMAAADAVHQAAQEFIAAHPDGSKISTEFRLPRRFKGSPYKE